MSIILRGNKGEPLTHEEMDGNFVELDHRLYRSGVSPSASDDTTRGFEIGDEWKVLTPGFPPPNYITTTYECLSNTEGSAVWAEKNNFIGNEDDFVVSDGVVNIRWDNTYGRVFYGADFVWDESSSTLKMNYDYLKGDVFNMGGSTRPASGVGYECFFDTNLGKPIWWNGAEWVDATGTVV